MDISEKEQERFHFRLIPPEQIRGGVVCFLLIMLIPLLVTLAAPMLSPYLYSAAILYAVMLGWGVVISVNPYRYEAVFTLYMGIYGAALAVTSEIAILKMMYDIARVESPWYGASSVILMAAAGLLFGLLHIRAVRRGTYQEMERKGLNRAGKAALLLASIGYLAYYLATAFFGELGSMVLGMAGFSVLLIFGLYVAVVFIHRYLFIRRNMDKLRALYPALGLPKEEREAAYMRARNEAQATAKRHRQSKKRRRS
ncbi:hypothetical protein ABDI30_24160 [Paenibacillus cisolokensis]|uniref:hypothetical protein n=1 Tax=Paenibacillus cisolokensis TaxID=1658519 RepID=UPI003D2AAA83